MRKRITPSGPKEPTPPTGGWLNLDDCAEVELTSEDESYPIESALLGDQGPGWRASAAGEQRIRLVFEQPQRIRRIALDFDEPVVARTQEFVLRWSADGGRSFQDVVRQQWNFSPGGAAHETEDLSVELDGVTELELVITPDISGGDARASLARWRLAG